MFQMHDRNVGMGRRDWLLPVALFFVSIAAMARAVLETRLAPPGQTLVRLLGPVPTLVLFLGTAALAVAWYARGTVASPFRKVLGLILLCLPLAGFLGALQAAPGPESGLWGGIAGRNIATVLPAVMGAGVTGLLLLFSGFLAWKLAFQREGPATGDPLSRTLRGGLETFVVPTATAAAPATDPEPAIDDAVGEVIEEEEGSLFAPRPAHLPDDAEEDEDVRPIVDSGDDAETEAPEEIPAFLKPERILGDLVPPEAVEAMVPPAPVAALKREMPAEPPEIEQRFAAMEAAEVAGLAPTGTEGPAAGLFAAGSASEDRLATEAVAAEEERLVAGQGETEIFGQGIALEEDEEEMEGESEEDASGPAPRTAVAGEVEDEDVADEDFEDFEEDEAETAEEDVLVDEEETEDGDESEEIVEAEAVAGAEALEDQVEVDGEEVPAYLQTAAGTLEEAPVEADAGSAVLASAGDDRPEASPRAWRVLRGSRGPEEPTVILPRAATDEVSAPSVHLRAAIESSSTPDSSASGERRPEDSGQEWAMWDDEPARAKPRRAPARQPSPAAEAAAEDQQILFAHRSEVDETIYRQAVDVVVGEERCSVAMLQRKLQVSFSEATAIIERMHDEGVVGPQLPSGRREILATRGGRQKTESTEA